MYVRTPTLPTMQTAIYIHDIAHIYPGACEVAKEIKHQDEATEIQS